MIYFNIQALMAKRATVKVAPTNAGMTSIFVGATFTVALFAQIPFCNYK